MIKFNTTADIASVKVGNDDFATFYKTGSDGYIKVRVINSDQDQADREYLELMEGRREVSFDTTLEVTGDCWIYFYDCSDEKHYKLEPGRYFVYTGMDQRVIFDLKNNN